MDLAQLLVDQDGVVCRRQVLACGEHDHDIRRRVRRREWAQVHTGVYVHHTGPLTWRQRAWAATLLHRDAALAGPSALRALGVTRYDDPTGPIHLVVPAGHRVEPTDGVRVRGCSDHAKAVHPARLPRTVTVEHAALAVAGAARSEDAAVAVLADGCQSRLTTADRLCRQLERMPRLTHRRLVAEVLDDVATGAFSALERRYLVRVERAHGLPTASRQARVPGARAAYRDVEHPEHGLVVELDGRLAHGAPGQRWADLDRDLDSLARGDLTLRVGWGQVLEPCRLGLAVARVLHLRGWTGKPAACSPGCVVGGSQSPGG